MSAIPERRHGITVEDVRRALPEHPSEAAADDARQIYVSAQAEASELQHVEVEPGHLFLAIARDPTCVGHQTLGELRVDVDELSVEVAERLPTIVHDEAFHRELVKRYPRLPRAEVQQLLRNALAWRAANRTLRDHPGLGPNDERQLKQVVEETRSAWLTRCYTTTTSSSNTSCPTPPRAQTRLGVVGGSWALNSLVLAEEPAPDVGFEEQARTRVAAELKRRLA